MKSIIQSISYQIMPVMKHIKKLINIYIINLSQVQEQYKLDMKLILKIKLDV